MSKLLINESPLQVQPSLAKAIGLHEAIFLQQLHYWMGISRFIRYEKKWVYNTYEQWLGQLKYLSLPTLKRAIKSLKAQKLLYVERLDRMRSNQVNYYSINYEVLDGIERSIRTESEIEMNNIESKNEGSKSTNRLDQDEPKENIKLSSFREDQDEPILTIEYQENTHKNNNECLGEKLIDVRAIELTHNIDRDLWVQFVEMRQSLKKPLTNNAAYLLIKKLEKFGSDANQSLENSIIASYQSVYPPTKPYPKPKTKPEVVKRFGQRITETRMRDVAEV